MGANKIGVSQLTPNIAAASLAMYGATPLAVPHLLVTNLSTILNPSITLLAGRLRSLLIWCDCAGGKYIRLCSRST